MTDKEYYLDFWTPTLGAEEALRSWEVKIAEQEKRFHHYMPDIQPYQNMVDGKMITSRSEHREFLKKYNLNEVGNETKYLEPKPPKKDPTLKETLIRVVNEKWRKR